MAYAQNIGAPYALVKETKELGRLPVVNFAAGGSTTPADAALMMQLGVDGVIVGSGIFKSKDPALAPEPSWKRPPISETRKSWRKVSENLGRTNGGHQRQQSAGKRTVGNTRLVEDRG
ncbi:MAG: hypothetical protein M5U34_19635 [Chloroflexi bacterium]|nr:hypothetical protein [Chloroflexota bacterium]